MLKHAVKFVKVDGKIVCMRADKVDELKKKNKNDWKKNLKLVAKLINTYGEEELNELIAAANIKAPFDKVAKKVAGAKKWKNLNDKQRHILTEVLYTMALDRNGGSIDEETDTVDSETEKKVDPNAIPAAEFASDDAETTAILKKLGIDDLSIDESVRLYCRTIITILWDYGEKYRPAFDEYNEASLAEDYEVRIPLYYNYIFGHGEKPATLNISDPELFGEFRALFRVIWMNEVSNIAMKKIEEIKGAA